MSTRISEFVYVWTWLPGESAPVPAGVLNPVGSVLHFRYSDRYPSRPGAVPLGPDLPFDGGPFGPADDLALPGTLRDAAPDAWGRRVLLNQLTGRRGRDADTDDLPESVYLLESGSDRLGALDFQRRSDDYVPRLEAATLDQLQRAAQMVADGEPLPAALVPALLGGTSMGGARPKAVLQDEDRQWIAKFSVTDDTYSVVGAEAVSISLARRAGLRVPESRVVRSLDRTVLLTERFDRGPGGSRRPVVSALTILELGEMSARYATYPDLLDRLRAASSTPSTVGRELFVRIAFNMAISNTDDHARNHAAFWDGRHLDLTPAYDLSPASRSGETATQAMAYGRDGEKGSDLADLLAVAHEYDLSARDARSEISRVLDTIREHWDDAADRAELSEVDRRVLWGRQFLNPGTVRGFERIAVAPAFRGAEEG